MENKSGFKKYFFNTSWLMAEKVFRIVISLIITIWLARYLGPEQFGTFNYVLSFVALFSVLASLGFDKLLTREFLSHPQDSGVIMGTSFMLRLLGVLFIVPLSAFTVTIIRPDNKLIFIMVLIISSALFFNSFEIIKYWFESHVQAKYSAIIDAIVIFTSSSIKAILIVLEGPLVAFAWVIFIESLILAIGLITIYKKKSNKLSTWKVSFDKAKTLLKEACPLILSGAVFILFIRVDQIMLGSMVGDGSVGIYAAAVRISGGWMFIPAIIATSFFPAMLNARKYNYSLYLQRTQHLINIMVLLGVSVGLVVIFIADPFINVVFGESYSESSLVLIIHIWGMVFNAVSIISFRYFLAEGLQIYSFYRAFAGLILNILLNYHLIPAYGAVGAAVSTAISQAVAAYFLNIIGLKTRPMFLMQSKALLLYDSINTLKQLKTLRAGG